MRTKSIIQKVKLSGLLGFCSLLCCALAASAQAVPSSLNPRVALVLGGGGARGIAHVGVLKVLEQQHIPIDLIVGTSAGSMIAALYADNPHADALKDWLMQASLLDIVDLSPSLQGAVSGYKLQHFFARHMQARYFEQLKIPVIAVATDLKTGETILLGKGLITPAINASGAVPPVFSPVKLYGRTLIDGGFTDLIPVDVAKRYKPQIIIAVNIVPDLPHQPPGNIINVYQRTYALTDARFAQYNLAGADVILHPYVGQTGIFDSSNKVALYRAGERAARRALPQICALLQAKSIASKCS